MVRNYKGCTGLKTGSTSLALYNLSASATRDNLNLIAVVMKAPSSKLRFEIASKLLDYGFSNFEYKRLITSNDIIKSVKVNKGISSYVNAIAKSDCGTLISKGNDVNIEQNVCLDETISAPIYSGQTIGQITYTLNQQVIGTVDIVCDKDVKKSGLVDIVPYLYKNWFCLLRNDL